MKKIKLEDYNSSLGELISLDKDIKINFIYKYIDEEKLLYNYANILNKNNFYYIICKKGQKSKRVVNILEFYGYNVSQVIK